MLQRPMATNDLDNWRANRPLLGSTAQVVALACAVLAFFFCMARKGASGCKAVAGPAIIAGASAHAKAIFNSSLPNINALL